MPAASSRAAAPTRSITRPRIPTRWRCCARCRGSTSRGAAPARSRRRPTARPARLDGGLRLPPALPLCRRQCRDRPPLEPAEPGISPPASAAPSSRRSIRRWRAAGMSNRASASQDAPLLDVRHCHASSPSPRGCAAQDRRVKAVDGVDFDIKRGETLGLVGESGCGKTTTGRCILRLESRPPGEILFDGHDVDRLDRQAMIALRRRMQVIFQDPYSSLNPRMKVGDIIAEPIKVHGVEPEAQAPRAGARAAVGVRPRSQHVHRPLSARDVGRPAPARRHRPRAGARSASSSSATRRCRRSTCRSRPRSSTCWRTCASASASPICSSPTTCRWCAHLCQRVAVMYLGRIVEMADATSCSTIRCIPTPRPCSPAVPVPDPRIEATQVRAHHQGRGAEPDQSAVRLRLPSALPDGVGGMPRGRAGSRGNCAGPLGGLYSRLTSTNPVVQRPEEQVAMRLQSWLLPLSQALALVLAVSVAGASSPTGGTSTSFSPPSRRTTTATAARRLPSFTRSPRTTRCW